MRRSDLGRPVPLPAATIPTVVAVAIIVVVAFFLLGLEAGVVALTTAFLGWVTGVLHERSAWRWPDGPSPRR